MAEITQRDSRRQAVAWLNDERIGAEIRRALPRHVDLDYFLRVAQTSILNNPAIANANKESLLRELVAVAQLGLVTDPQLGEAWLIVDGKGNVQRRVGYQGLRKLALQSGEVTAINAQVVYANDQCEIELGDRPSVKHRVGVQMGDRGKAIGCYAIARIKGTEEPSVEWMSWSEIERHRDRYSDAYKRKSGPWTDELAQHEMARKTVFRRLAKWMPKSPVLAEALADEDRADMRDVTPDQRALPAPDDPMDRIVAEQRGNGTAKASPPEPAAEAPAPTEPPTRAETSSPAGEPTARQEPARRSPGRPKKPETVAREEAQLARQIIAEIGSTDPEYVSDYLAERSAEIAGLSAPWQGEVQAAARKREDAASELEPYNPETGEVETHSSAGGSQDDNPDDSDRDEQDDGYERWLQDMSAAMAGERREFLVGRKNQFLQSQPYGERGAAAVQAAYEARQKG